MTLPEALKTAIQNEIIGLPLGALKEAREELSHRYRDKQEKFVRPAMSSSQHRNAYITARMPATYAVVCRVLEELRYRFPEMLVESVLDLGAGPGTASWAVSSLLPQVNQIMLIERDSELISLGKRLAQASESSSLKSATWLQEDFATSPTFPEHDVVILSYVIGELSSETQQMLLQNAWNAAKSFLIVIEPGTPVGYQNILSARTSLTNAGAFLAAPCPQQGRCPMEGDRHWCHFSQRVERMGEHRQLKEGSLGYEDEKFSYVIGSKMPVLTPQNRVFGHPLKRSGHLCLTLCTSKATIEQVTISRKEGDLYRFAKKIEWGDGWPPQEEIH